MSIVVVSFNMERELARTLLSLSRPYQRGVAALDYEVILVDNGSARAPRQEDFAHLGLNLTIAHQPNPNQSPMEAANLGLSLCRGDLIGVIIDGARMLSPGVLLAVSRARRLHDRAIVFTQSMTLGHGIQYLIAGQGYDQQAEDRLLESVGWPDDGYRLFEIATGLDAAVGERRWFAPLYESNGLFMPSELWRETGGYETQFQTPGGGAGSLDLFCRACALPDTQLVAITGEASFHQLHSQSASTAAEDAVAKLKLFSREYHRIRGQRLRQVTLDPWTFSVARWPDEQPAAASAAKVEDRYVDLVKQVLLNEHEMELEATCLALQQDLDRPAEAIVEPVRLARLMRRLKDARAIGVSLGAYPSGYTMVGRKRLDSLQQQIEQVIADDVAGDFVECGVWRGGACIMMRALLAAHGIRDRRIWVADSFRGLPPPAAGVDDDIHLTADVHPGLAISLEAVQRNFDAFGLRDDQVRFLEGWFCDTLPTAPIETIAILRMDGDLYSSTIDILDNLYDRVSRGGFIIVDDYHIPACARAVADFRSRHGSTEPLLKIDWTGVYWRKA